MYKNVSSTVQYSTACTVYIICLPYQVIPGDSSHPDPVCIQNSPKKMKLSADSVVLALTADIRGLHVILANHGELFDNVHVHVHQNGYMYMYILKYTCTCTCISEWVHVHERQLSFSFFHCLRCFSFFLFLSTSPITSCTCTYT